VAELVRRAVRWLALPYAWGVGRRAGGCGRNPRAGVRVRACCRPLAARCGRCAPGAAPSLGLAYVACLTALFPFPSDVSRSRVSVPFPGPNTKARGVCVCVRAPAPPVLCTFWLILAPSLLVPPDSSHVQWGLFIHYRNIHIRSPLYQHAHHFFVPIHSSYVQWGLSILVRSIHL
jgi:hypothetical protein